VSFALFSLTFIRGSTNNILFLASRIIYAVYKSKSKEELVKLKDIEIASNTSRVLRVESDIIIIMLKASRGRQ
jgi:hypothetical protein